MDILSFIRFLFLLSVLIFVHEGGHFLFAKLFGVSVEEFGFGIPPRVVGKKIKDTIYSLNLLPIGGFVRLKGEDGETLGFGGADSFAVQSKVKRALIIAAGAFGNFVLAWLIFSVLLVVGVPVSSGKVLVLEVSEGSPAEKAGILPDDFILSLGGQEASSAETLTDLTKQNLGEQVVVEVESGGEIRSVEVVPRENPPKGEGSLGVLVQTATE
jgi:regulator of sigma E protease